MANLVAFVIIPVINISWTVATIMIVDTEHESNYLLIFICFYTMFSVAQFASYFLIERKRFTDEIILYLKLTEAMKSPDFEDAKKIIFMEQEGELTLAQVQTRQILEEIQNEDKAYIERQRKYGEGSLRMGTAVELTEDIYCITYLSMLRADHIAIFLNI